MRSILTLLLFGALITGTFAQRPRTIEPEPTSKPAARSAPQTVKAKYEGGVFGYTKTMEGTLSFDDENSRLLFKDKQPPKEISIPYESLTKAFADTQKRQPAAATVASSVPTIFTLPAKFIKTKVRYLTLQFNDPDSKVSGITSFKLENKEILASVLARLAEKTGMTLHGDIYIKKRDDSSRLNP